MRIATWNNLISEFFERDSLEVEQLRAWFPDCVHVIRGALRCVKQTEVTGS